MQQTEKTFNPVGCAERSWNDVVSGFLTDEVIKEARVADGCVMLFFASGRQVSFAAKTKPMECKCCGETRRKPVIDAMLAAPPATLFD